MNKQIVYFALFSHGEWLVLISNKTDTSQRFVRFYYSWNDLSKCAFVAAVKNNNYTRQRSHRFFCIIEEWIREVRSAVQFHSTYSPTLAWLSSYSLSLRIQFRSRGAQNGWIWVVLQAESPQRLAPSFGSKDSSWTLGRLILEPNKVLLEIIVFLININI